MSRAPLSTVVSRRDTKPKGPGARGASGWKILVAILLLGTALVYGLHRYARLNPPLEPEPPQAVQQDAALLRAVEDTYKGQLDALGLTPEQRKQLNHWIKTPPGPNATKEERRAHAQELQKILSAEQIYQFRQARKEHYQNRQAIRKRHEDRMKSMLGEQDYALHKENMKRLREEQKARNLNPTPSPTQTPAT